MSGPWAETGPLHVRTPADVAWWPLRHRSDSGVATIECAECDSGGLLTTDLNEQPFVIAELVARVEAHIAKCPGVRGRS
jgi:hypothetical protein